MGMGNSLLMLRATTNTLEKTWQRWFEEEDLKRRKKLEANFEYLLSETETLLGYAIKEWRGAFKKPKKKPKYDQELQNKYVNSFVPSWERRRKKKA